MRCNNCDGLLQLSFTLKFQYFRMPMYKRPYIFQRNKIFKESSKSRGIFRTQANIYDGAFIANMVSP